MSNKMLQ